MKRVLKLVLAACQLVTVSHGFTGKAIFSSPSTVQHKNAMIEFYAVPETTIPAGGYVKLTAPNNIPVHSSDSIPCYDVLNDVQCLCSATAKTFTITTSKQLLQGQQFQFQLQEAIDNPMSTTPTNSWRLLTSLGESLDEEMYLTATQGSISQFSVEPRSSVVGASTDVVLKWRGVHSVPKDSFFQITFPIWNSGDPTDSNHKTFIQGAVSCSPIVVLSSKLQCAYSDYTLTISGGVTSDITPGTDISLLVTGFKNPIDTALVTDFTVTSLVRSNGVFYPIDTGIGTLQVADYAQISQGKLEVRFPELPSAGMIQQADDMKLSFYLPVPLDQGCQVTVVLPEQYSITTVDQVGSLQVFGYYKEYSRTDNTLQINEAENSFTISPCDTYRENDNIGVIYISKLMQYKFEKATDSLKIRIKTESGEKVAQIESNIAFTPSRGASEIEAIATVPTVQTETSLVVTLRPEHQIYADDVPQVMITFPPEVKVSSCAVSDVIADPQPLNPTCSRDSAFGQTITIKDFMTSDYVPGGDPIQFTLGQVINPFSTQPVEGLEVVILAQGRYAIDEYVGPTPWLLKPGTMQGVSINPGSYQAYRAENTYEIQFTPEHEVPKNGYVQITFPPQVLVPDTSYSSSSCLAPQPQGFPIEAINCQIDQESSGANILTIINAFRRQRGQAKRQYSISLPGVQNPIRIVPTDAFIFKTLTSDGYEIDQFEGANIQMLTSAEIQNIELVPSNFQNSKPVTYSFTMMPSVPVTGNMVVLVSFPPQITLSESENFNCQSTYTNLISSVSCSLDKDRPNARANTVKVAMDLNVPFINGQDRIGFTIGGITNPPSTQTTDSLQIRIVDGTTYANVNQKLFGVTITTIEPHPIQKASIVPGTYQPGISTEYIIDFYPENAIQSEGGILVTIPRQISSIKDVEIEIEAEVSGRTVDNQAIYHRYQESAHQITIENVIQGPGLFEPDPTRKITIKIFGLNTPFTNEPTDSFEVSSFNKINGMYFFIDAAKQGLFIISTCSYPCNTCMPSDPDFCTSCFEIADQSTGLVGLPYLQLGTCVADCAFGRYYDQESKQCELCDSTCLTCETTAQKCTTCGQLDFPYFYEDKCLQDCPDGYLGNYAANKCQQCASTCLTCEKTLSTCTSCDKESLLPLFYRMTCIDTCPPEVSVLVGDDTCEVCDPSCKTCEGTPETCVTCAQHMKFDPLNKKCTAECEPETQIYNPDLETCDQCNATCTKCQGDVNKCVECKEGYVLNDDFTCQLTCNDELKEVKQTGVDGICMDCEEPCKTCNAKVDHCTTCFRDPIPYLLHLKSTCVQYCPHKYNMTADGMECEYVGLKCPDKFEIDSSGDGCVPVDFECAEGYELNENNSACVPAPGSPVPFPFLIATIFVSFLVLGSYLKEKFFTKVYTCLISIIGSFEIIMYSLMVGFAAVSGEWAICVLCLFGLIALLISNIAFTVYYQRDVYSKDDVFSKWLYFFPKTKKFIPVVSVLLNFKCSKMLYSGFYGLESSMAKFGRPLEYYRVVRMVSYFSFIFCYGFIFLADLVIFFRVKWGYQLLVLGVETAILQILIIVLTYLESRSPPAELLSVGTTQYTTINPKRRREVKVMSGFQEQQYDSDDDDYEQGIPDVDEKMFIRSKEEFQQKEVKLRNTAFTKIIKQVQANFKNKVDQCDLQEVMTKFDPVGLKVRRAFSMRGRTNADDSEWSAEGDYPEDLNSAAQTRDFQDDVRCYMRERRYSWPLLKQVQGGIQVDKFENQIDDIMLADDEYLIDNCGKEVKPIVAQEISKPKKMVSRRTQTYLRELLQLDGYEQNDSEQSLIMDDDAEIDDAYAQGLIHNVLQNVSGNEAASDFEEQMNEQSFEQYQQAKKDQPEFDIQDIMGCFDQDDLGNYIIVRKSGSAELLDKQGRRVNRRGYLVDKHGNVINHKQNVIFKAMELDADDEIPAPFDQLPLGEEPPKPNVFNIMNQPAPVSEDVQKNPIFEAQNQQPVSEPEVADDESESEHLEDIQSVSNVEALIDDITKEKVPKRRKFLKSNSKPTHQVGDNHPPKRFGPGSGSGGLYPMIGIENEEQRRLAIIADQISGVTQKLAMDNGRYNLGIESQNSADMISNQDRFKQIKEQTLNEIMNNQDSHRNLIQQRPSSVHPDFTNSQKPPKKQRPHTGTHSVNVPKGGRRRGDQQSTSATRQPPTDKFSLQKIYQNIDQLVGLEEQQMQTLFQESRNANESRTQQFDQRRMTGDAHRMQGLESIYLKQSQQRNQGQQRATTAARPFRPTLRQYEDDPGELTVETAMDGVRFGRAAAKDVSLMMADRVDQLQRGYMQQSNNLSQKHASLLQNNGAQMMQQMARGSDMDMSEYRMPQQQPAQQDPNTVVRHDNWLQ